MKLSEKSKEILKNFAMINGDFRIQIGKTQSTRNKSKSFLCRAELEEDFPTEIGIVSFEKVVKCLEKIPASEIHFDKDSIRVANDTSSATFATVLASSLPEPSKDIKVEYLELKIPIKRGLFKEFQEYARLMRTTRDGTKTAKGPIQTTEYNTLVFDADGKHVYAQVQERSEYANQILRVNLGKTSEKFKVSLHLDHCHLIEDDYVLELCPEKRIARYTSANHPVTYFQGLALVP